MKITVVKIGGNVIDDATALRGFLRSFAALPHHQILVHGGGKIATEIGYKLGIEPNYINGRRITDEATRDLVTMVYAGAINKNIVQLLQAAQCNAFGLTGADGGVIPAALRPVKEVDYGYVGDVVTDKIKVALLRALLQLGLTPVFAPLTFNKESGILNTNADTIARELAIALSAVAETDLVYCFEKDGVLSDPSDAASVIPIVTAPIFDTLKKENIVGGGMIPKLENALSAVAAGVKKVTIGSSLHLQELIDGKKGTTIL